MNYEIKRELQNIISGEKSFGKGNIIQSIANYLRGSKKASRNAKEGKFQKQEETEYLVDCYSTEKNHFQTTIFSSEMVFCCTLKGTVQFFSHAKA